MLADCHYGVLVAPAERVCERPDLVSPKVVAPAERVCESDSELDACSLPDAIKLLLL